MAARLLSLTDVAVSLRNQLIADLASHSHEGVLLPQAERNEATGTYKNIAFRLNGREAPAPHKIFSPKWMSGVSMVKIKTAEADRLLAGVGGRALAFLLRRFSADACPPFLAMLP